MSIVVKRQNIEADIGNGLVKVARSIAKWSDAIRVRAQAKSNATPVTLELKIFRAMHLPEEDYNVTMEALSRSTYMLQHVPGSGNEGDLTTVQVTEGKYGSPFGGGAVSAHDDIERASTGSEYFVQFNDANEDPRAKEHLSKSTYARQKITTRTRRVPTDSI